MRMGEIAEKLSLTALTPGDPAAEISGAYVSDLLSDVMAQAKQGSIWITIQTHQNVVAVASLLSLGAVVIAGGHAADPETLAKGRSQGVALYASTENSFTLAGRLYQLGLR